jgi:uncharacterized protein YceH (UPF0502 family)
MDILLNPAQARVLGSLVEKDITTPEYYPLSLNALVNACNQKSNREPVMSLSEDAVRDALAGLQEYRLAGPASSADSRVPKYEHRLQEVFNFDRHESALLCVLLLRGPQTPGELRGRTERMYHFDSLDDVQAGLQKLMQRTPPLAALLPRQPGSRESRYAHLLSGPPEEAAAEHISVHAADTAATSANSAMPWEEGLSTLRDEVSALRQEVSDLKSQLATFRKQFE